MTQAIHETRAQLVALLAEDLDFHDQNSRYGMHGFHAFPAKFPPQLPRLCIEALTPPGGVVCDPMMGSGTTVLEAQATGRRGIGCDIDPLAALMTQVKVTDYDGAALEAAGDDLLERAARIAQKPDALLAARRARWDSQTRQFVDYWFAPQTQAELVALAHEINRETDPAMRRFFQATLSGIIITKSGGVSMAFDLAHTRPHRARVVLAPDGTVIHGHERANDDSRRTKLLTKTLRSPLIEFRKRLERSLSNLPHVSAHTLPPSIHQADAQHLPLAAETVNLIVTSPPYISNAIDYMRAHKFSLVWLGYPIPGLGQHRKRYVGGEAVTDFRFEELPPASARIVATISDLDAKRGQVVHRYYSEMTRVLREMHRVLKPGAAAVMVVGTSIIRGVDTHIDQCLAEIGRAAGFDVPAIGVRHLDRDRRMLPAGARRDLDSQIQQRMHEEYVLGFLKP